MPPTRGLVERIGYGRKHRRKCGLTKSGGVNIAFHKMDINGPRHFIHSYHPVLVEVIRFRYAVPEGQVTMQRIANTVNNSAFTKIGGGIRVYQHAAINRTGYFFHPWSIAFHNKVQYLGNVSIVAKVGGYSAVQARYFRSPVGLLLHKFQNAGITMGFIVVFFAYRIFLSSLQKLEAKVNWILTRSFRHFVQERLLGGGHKIGPRRTERSDGDVGGYRPVFRQVV